MDYYSLLGVGRNASQDEIKKAYKKACMKHHPDRGGDEAQFKQINEAYDVLSDPHKRQMHDMGVNPNRQQNNSGFHRGPFEFRFGDNFDDIFGGFGFSRPRPKNKSINIAVTISLEDVLFGKTMHVDVAMPSGNRKVITIEIPKGIESGQHIRYQGLGDSSISGMPPGDLIVNIVVSRHPLFNRQGDNLIFEKRISVWDSLLGSTITIKTLDDKNLNITIPSGTQPDTVLSCRGEGLPNVHSQQRGNILVKIKIDIPKNLSKEQQAKILDLKNNL